MCAVRDRQCDHTLARLLTGQISCYLIRYDTECPDTTGRS
ncbi:hypothetical protein M2251_000146 [Rhodococcus erythropolis]|nr:hypothetical protein [Rhodococcus erythropolis]